MPQHVARLVTRLVAPLVVDYSASCRLVVDYSASRRLVVDNSTSRRLVVDYFAYAARPGASVLTDKTRIHLRSASVRTYTFFTMGIPRFLSIRGARGLLALNQVLI
jgi:hypothetical protein